MNPSLETPPCTNPWLAPFGLDRVGHELRRPLAAIQAFGELLEDEISGTLNNDQRDQVRTILRHTHALHRSIDDLLEVSAIEQGPIATNVERVDLGQLFEEVAEEYSRDFARSGSGLECRIDGPLTHLSSDRQRLRGVLARLLENCLRHCPQETRVLLSLSQDDGEVLIGVEDDGPGVSEEQLEAIFLKSFRIESESSSPDGMGLGLYVCRALVEGLGGTITARSGQSEGLRVEVRLPA